MLFFRQSPYLKNSFRLADLIAAIQVLGTYQFASRTLEKWEKRLGRKPMSADSWLQVFREHPEFFTIQDEELVSVVWRRSRERVFDTLNGQVLGWSEAAKMKQEENQDGYEKRLSRPPLSTAEVSKLIDIAINLHEREIKHRQERRWWITAAIGILGLVISAFV
jgi:hypothetical protein